MGASPFWLCLLACCFGFLKEISCYSRRDDNFISKRKNLFGANKLETALPFFQNKIFWKWQLLYFEFFKSNFSIFQPTKPPVMSLSSHHLILFHAIFWFIGWVVGFPQLIWEYPKNLPPSPSHFWGGVACGCCVRRLRKVVPNLFQQSLAVVSPAKIFHSKL